MKCHKAVVWEDELPSPPFNCLDHSACNIPLLPSSISKPKAQLLLFLSLLALWHFQTTCSALHRNPRVVPTTICVLQQCDREAPCMGCHLACSQSGSFEKSVQAFLWIFSCFHSVNLCNTLQKQSSPCDVCATSACSQCPNLVKDPLSREYLHGPNP